jgi:hypothetical protein
VSVGDFDHSIQFVSAKFHSPADYPDHSIQFVFAKFHYMWSDNLCGQITLTSFCLTIPFILLSQNSFHAVSKPLKLEPYLTEEWQLHV